MKASPSTVGDKVGEVVGTGVSGDNVGSPVGLSVDGTDDFVGDNVGASVRQNVLTQLFLPRHLESHSSRVAYPSENHLSQYFSMSGATSSVQKNRSVRPVGAKDGSLVVGATVGDCRHGILEQKKDD